MSEEIQTFRMCRNDLELEEITSVLAEAGINYVTAANTAH